MLKKEGYAQKGPSDGCKPCQKKFQPALDLAIDVTQSKQSSAVKQSPQARDGPAGCRLRDKQRGARGRNKQKKDRVMQHSSEASTRISHPSLNTRARPFQTHTARKTTQCTCRCFSVPSRAVYGGAGSREKEETGYLVTRDEELMVALRGCRLRRLPRLPRQVARVWQV